MVSETSGDACVGVVGESDEADREVAEGGHDLWGVAGVEVVTVFVVGDVSDPMEGYSDARVMQTTKRRRRGPPRRHPLLPKYQNEREAHDKKRPRPPRTGSLGARTQRSWKKAAAPLSREFLLRRVGRSPGLRFLLEDAFPLRRSAGTVARCPLVVAYSSGSCGGLAPPFLLERLRAAARP